MESPFVVVGGVVPTDRDDTNLRDEVWSFVLDQRFFGPRRLLVAFADADGRFRGMAETARRATPEDGLGPCIEHLGLGAAAAVAFCDERVTPDLPPDLAARFARARAIAASYGVHLVDWFMCDDDLFRSMRYSLELVDESWWDVDVC